MIGVIPISYVVAAVLGITNNARHDRAAILIILAKVFPDLDNISSKLPEHFADAIITKSAIPASASTKANIDTSQLCPDTKPKYGGNSKLPAPKNIEKSANPTIIISFICLLMIVPPIFKKVNI